MNSLQLSAVFQAVWSGNTAFSAEKIRATLFEGLMDPIIGFDHFKLTNDVFGAHPHVGISAISYLFEDSAAYHNLDSIGTDLMIKPGSMLWTWAGRGVVNTEFSIPHGGQVHGLQIFINIPAAKKQFAPHSTYINTSEIPEIQTDGVRIRVMVAQKGDVINPIFTPEPLTFLHLFLAFGKSFQHQLPTGWTGTIYVVSGEVGFHSTGGTYQLNKANVIAFGRSDNEEILEFTALSNCQLILLSAQPLNEAIFAQGSTAMSSPLELNKAKLDFTDGRIGFMPIAN